ncbi:hypothetical protein ONZ51_g10773 [Trametes cubensis]|uniref:Uncharacterized protein n=1 Tax=Trametes cubensis TaxID=1111947 RepID=A0AAD7X6Z2_9APHY|nr:hypothetical protein ONZ51_g10773 [Trametes cubensis]
MFTQQVVPELPADEEGQVQPEPAEVPPIEEAEEEPPSFETHSEPEAEYPKSEFGGNRSQYESDREELPSPMFEEEIEFKGMHVTAMKEIETNLMRAHAMAVQPERNIRHGWLYDAKRTLYAETPINGIKALALFNLGCTTHSMTHEMAYGLQLGTKGSRTHINFGVRATVQVGQVKSDHYFDVVDINKCNVILGTTFY